MPRNVLEVVVTWFVVAICISLTKFYNFQYGSYLAKYIFSDRIKLQECPPISYRICHNRILFYFYSIEDHYLMATCVFFPTGRSSYNASPTRESRSHSLLGHKHYIHPINPSMVNTFNLHLSNLFLTFP